MIVLQIYLTCFEGKESELELRFQDTFIPAISVQKGYQGAQLICSLQNPRRYNIEFAFESEESRQNWVASDEHERVLPVINALCSDSTFAIFDVVYGTYYNRQ